MSGCGRPRISVPERILARAGHQHQHPAAYPEKTAVTRG